MEGVNKGEGGGGCEQGGKKVDVNKGGRSWKM